MTLAADMSEMRTAPAPRSTPMSAKASRLLWLDVAKGLGIVIVVTGHALGGIIDSSIGSHSSVLRLIFLAIYSFHMPLFFLLSGLLVKSRIERGPGTFFRNILVTVVYPYFLWSLVQYSAIYAAGSLVNRPVAAFWLPILNLPRSSISQFWFLYVLFLLHMAALILLPRIGAKAFLALMMVARFLAPLVAFPPMLHVAMIHGMFYAIGVTGGVAGVETFYKALDRHKWLAPLLIIGGIAGVAVAMGIVIVGADGAFYSLHSPEISARAWRLPSIPTAALTVTAFLVIARSIRGIAATVLAYLGQRTMAIFVLHILFIAGIRIVISHFVHLGLLPMTAVCLIVGMAGPLLVYAVVKRVANTRLAGLG